MEIRLRPLGYPRGKRHARGIEKGIDVLLALDLAFGAADGDFDVVVLFSGDSDLLPALERADSSGVACEVGAWAGGRRQQPKRSYIKFMHLLQQPDYEQVRDPLSYR